MSIKRLLVIVGPTGSGKTDLSLRVARRYGAPILSTDSRQFYRGMAIGTAQPTVEEQQLVEHHFIASHEITESLNCGTYEQEALACLERLFRHARRRGGRRRLGALCPGLVRQDGRPAAGRRGAAHPPDGAAARRGLEPLPRSFGSLIRPTAQRLTCAIRRGWSGPLRCACRRDAPTRNSVWARVANVPSGR